MPTLIPFPKPLPRCCDCGAPFRPAQPWHRRCLDCWHWLAIGLSVHRASRHLREVRP